MAIVNEEFIHRFYKDQTVIGRHIAVAGDRTIIGVVGNTRATSSGFGEYQRAARGASDHLHPGVAGQRQLPRAGAHLVLAGWVVRTSGPVAPVVDGLRRSIGAVDPMLPIAKMESMKDVQSASLADQRFMMTLILGLGAVALLLAAIGIHGLIANSVSERTRELGIRLALGATGSQIMREIVQSGLTLAAIGVAIGTAAAFATGRLPPVVSLGCHAGRPADVRRGDRDAARRRGGASVLPALRVLRLDPATTLRAE